MAPVRLRALAIVVMTLTLAACTGDQSVVPTTTPVWPPVVQLGVVKQDMDCPAAPTPPTVRITPLGSIPAPYRQEQPVRLNGISVLLGPKVATSVTYFVPSLHVVLLGFLWVTRPRDR
jgi:hypothetical protein